MKCNFWVQIPNNLSFGQHITLTFSITSGCWLTIFFIKMEKCFNIIHKETSRLCYLFSSFSNLQDAKIENLRFKMLQSFCVLKLHSLLSIDLHPQFPVSYHWNHFKFLAVKDTKTEKLKKKNIFVDTFALHRYIKDSYFIKSIYVECFMIKLKTVKLAGILQMVRLIYILAWINLFVRVAGLIWI